MLCRIILRSSHSRTSQIMYISLMSETCFALVTPEQARQFLRECRSGSTRPWRHQLTVIVFVSEPSFTDWVTSIQTSSTTHQVRCQESSPPFPQKTSQHPKPTSTLYVPERIPAKAVHKVRVFRELGKNREDSADYLKAIDRAYRLDYKQEEPGGGWGKERISGGDNEDSLQQQSFREGRRLVQRFGDRRKRQLIYVD